MRIVSRSRQSVQRAKTGVVHVRRIAHSRTMSRSLYVKVARVGGRSSASSECGRPPCAGRWPGFRQLLSTLPWPGRHSEARRQGGHRPWFAAPSRSTEARGWIPEVRRFEHRGGNVAPSPPPEPAARSWRPRIRHERLWNVVRVPAWSPRGEAAVVPVRRLENSRMRSRSPCGKARRAGGRSGATSGCRRQLCTEALARLQRLARARS